METIAHILESGELSLRGGGKYVHELESQMEILTGRRYDIAVSSATAGLMLMFSDPDFIGQEIILPAFTFMATMTAAQWNHMRLVFCDVDPNTWTLDPNDVAAKISDETKVIVPVNMFGNPAPYDQLLEAVGDRDIAILADTAQAMGSLYDGRPDGSFGHASVFSFSPSKILTGGEGGVILTDNKCMYEHCRDGRQYGDSGSYQPGFPGLNGRLTELQAAIILHQLPMLKERIASARARMELYKKWLPGVTFQQENGESAWKELTILVPPELRKDICEALLCNGIDHRTYWHRPLHETTAYKLYSQTLKDARNRCWSRPRVPVTEALASQVLSLPMHSEVTPENIELISEIIRSFL